MQESNPQFAAEVISTSEPARNDQLASVGPTDAANEKSDVPSRSVKALVLDPTHTLIETLMGLRSMPYCKATHET
jgi:hypothetical protein